MRKLLLIFCSIYALRAYPADREVRIFFDQQEQHRTTGDIVPKEKLLRILFLTEPCPLPIANAEHMHRAWMFTAAYQLGCWYPTIDGQYVFVGRIPEATFSDAGYWEALPRAVLNADGSAKISEHDYDSSTFLKSVLTRKTAESLQHRNETP